MILIDLIVALFAEDLARMLSLSIPNIGQHAYCLSDYTMHMVRH